jgi:tetratricopeptide (TPR) repeat protein
MFRWFARHSAALTLCFGSNFLAAPSTAAEPGQRVPEQSPKGDILLSQGRWEEAIKEFSAAARTEPHRPEVHANLGMAYYFKGDSASAAPAFQAALRLEQNRVDALHGLGLALYDRGDVAGAIAAFRASSRHNPAAYYNLGNALEQSGDRAGALEAYQQYLASTPPSPETKMLGDALRQNTFPTPAAGTAQDHLRRGQALLEANDAPGAVAAFLSALRLKPNYVDASNKLGLAFRAAGNLDEAIAAYQTAIRLDTKFSPAYRNLAQAFEEKGDRSAAAQGYDRYLLLAPEAADAAEVRARIARLRSGR